jgi:hypothetical protein
VTFTKPFMLKEYGKWLPPGSYEVETDEELFESLSFSAYRKIMTVIHFLPSTTNPGTRQTLKIDPAGLDAALRRDRAGEATDFNPEIVPGRLGKTQRQLHKDADKRAIERGENEGMPDPATPPHGEPYPGSAAPA